MTQSGSRHPCAGRPARCSQRVARPVGFLRLVQEVDLCEWVRKRCAEGANAMDNDFFPPELRPGVDAVTALLKEATAERDAELAKEQAERKREEEQSAKEFAADPRGWLERMEARTKKIDQEMRRRARPFWLGVLPGSDPLQALARAEKTGEGLSG